MEKWCLRVLWMMALAWMVGCSTRPVRQSDGQYASAQPAQEVATPAASLPQETGEDVLRHIRARYAGTETSCGTSNTPAFVCSGILFRATRFPTAGRYSWMPNPSSSTSIGVSASFLRQDSNMWNPYPSSNGFIMYPKTYADKYGATNLYVRCGYPQDAWTAEPEGCTNHERAGRHFTTKLCHQYAPPILTAQQWYAYGFRDDENQCAFGFVQGTGMTDTAAAFMAMIGARRLVLGEVFPQRLDGAHAGVLATMNRNEVILDDYRNTDPKAFPIEAFFYQNAVVEPGYQDPLTNAKEDQKIYKNLTGRWVPLIRWNMKRTDAQTFDYIAADQGVAPPGPPVSPGETVARHLQARYDKKDSRYQSCTNGAAAFVCSGVLIRGTGKISAPAKPWTPAPTSTQDVSFSWLSSDSIVTNLYYANGMIVMPAQFLDSGKSNLYVLCGYVANAGTNNMANKCMNNCQSMGITTVAQFTAKYGSSGAGCPFNVAKGTANAKQIWDNIATIRNNRNYRLWNEIIVQRAGWVSMKDSEVPVEAFYYLTTSTVNRTYAQDDQTNYKNVTGLWVPVIAVTLGATGATFVYNVSDQAISN